MKKSEMLDVLDRIVGHGGHHPTATAIVNAMEAKGQVWDPEEEPLPERLAITPNESYIGEFPDQDVTTWRFFFLLRHLDVHPDTLAVAREAVRRWNAWPKLREAIRLTLKVEPLPLLARSRLYDLLAILDGKEGE